MKIYYVPQFHPEQAIEVADIDETKYNTMTQFLDEMEYDDYDAFLDANGNDETRYLWAVRVFYGLYKEMLSGWPTQTDSYDPETKTIVVYVRNLKDMESKRNLYELLHK
jgi:hypothetical protein